jgi:hypothetical protein
MKQIHYTYYITIIRKREIGDLSLLLLLLLLLQTMNRKYSPEDDRQKTSRGVVLY